MKLINQWSTVLILCATLGLAPYVPEPHILGKLKWLLGGANGMQFMDYFDVVLHGTPWVLLIRLISIKSIAKLKGNG